jgi:hypothetical protein
MRYLMNPHKRKRVRLQDRILLWVRTLLLALLAMALARPLLRPETSDSSDKPTRNVIIVLDATYSMGQSVGQTTAFEVAQTMSQDIVRGLPNDATISLIQLDHRANVIQRKVSDLDSVHDAIGRARLSDMSGRMPDAIEAVEELLQHTTGLPPELYLVSDMQRSTWSPTPQDNRDALTMLASLSTRCDTRVLDTGGRSGFNAFMTRFEPDDKVMAVGMESRFEVDIAASDMPADSTLLVTLFVDENTNPTRQRGESSNNSSLVHRPTERKIATKELQVAELKDGRATLEFHYTFVEPGEHLLRVELSGDRLATDNRRYYLATVPRDVKVLVVDPSGGSDSSVTEPASAANLRGAIAPVTPPGFDRLSRYAVSVRNPSGVFELNMDEFGVVVLANVGNLTDGLTKRLEQYVADGGRLLIFVGDAVKPYEYNTKLLNGGAGLLPCELTDAVGLSPRDAARRTDLQSVREPGDNDSPVGLQIRPTKNEDETHAVLFELVYGGVGVAPHPAVANVRQMTKTAAPPSISRYMPVNGFNVAVAVSVRELRLRSLLYADGAVPWRDATARFTKAGGSADG